MVYILVEGHGEVEAISNLINRLWQDLNLPFKPISSPPIRWKNIYRRQGLIKGCEYIRMKGNATGLLILHDSEDFCPKEVAPQKAQIIRDLNLPFPVSCVLMYREYEVLFLPCLDTMAGKKIIDPRGIERPGIIQGATFDGDFEARRDTKGIISSFFPRNRTYKPTTDQLALTRMINFDLVRKAHVPCFGSLERGLSFIANNQSGVYPSPIIVT
ncbi:MAG: DUF4276 family protein [Bacteroidota bacterium]